VEGNDHDQDTLPANRYDRHHREDTRAVSRYGTRHRIKSALAAITPEGQTPTVAQLDLDRAI
jgi:hypothetical protein